MFARGSASPYNRLCLTKGDHCKVWCSQMMVVAARPRSGGSAANDAR